MFKKYYIINLDNKEDYPLVSLNYIVYSEASPTSNRKVKWGLLASSTVPENRSYTMSISVTSGASLPTIHLPLSLRLEEGVFLLNIR